MTIFDFKEYFEKIIEIITTDGKTYKGKVTGFDDAIDTSSGQDEIELYIGDCYVSVDVPSIKSFKLISD
ncbi:hypothetical protein [Ruminococcus flavefaciens]|uniref:hypothetical protein n=1 Tax=Ruminococcus flavefaciens TaxID=1265 RepID=UPI000561CEBA|nr:hypothetical protein [Ruminococcus flavefaciens]MCR4889754.1 hypothetical protein [Ruminococcus sp.]